VRLGRVVGQLWRRVAASHRRLVGQELHPVLAGLRALEQHATVPTIRQSIGELLESSDASGATVSYTARVRHSIDLVHCAAARVWDLGIGRIERTPTCGTARSPALDASWRRIQVVDVIDKMQQSARWKLTMLRRYLGDPAPTVRARAVGALAGLSHSLAAMAAMRALRDESWQVFTAAARALADLPPASNDEELSTTLRERAAALDPRDNPEAAIATARALAAIGAREALPLLHRWAGSPAWAVRRPAQAALVALTGQRATVPQPTAAIDLAEQRPARPLPTRGAIVTEKGRIALKLLPARAPLAVERFAKLAMQRSYRGDRIVRAVANRLVQTGSATGRSESDLPRIPCELTPMPVDRGSVSFVINGRDTARKDLRVSLARQPQLDGRVTVFARVVEGLEILDRLQPGDRLKDVYIPADKNATGGNSD
jgi:peptidyl-prolyl cis-trans isomerase B (cyclophilin B)